jgi:transposase-like protein
MVLDHLDEYRSVYAACVAIGPKVGVGVESLRRWVLQAQVDDSARPGITTPSNTASATLSEKYEISRRPTRFSRRPRFSSRGSSTRAAADLRIRRPDAGPRRRIQLAVATPRLFGGAWWGMASGSWRFGAIGGRFSHRVDRRWRGVKTE